MGPRLSFFFVVAFVAGVAMIGTATARACNVPVFRYGLERWKPDVYRAILFHDGPLTPELESLVAILRNTNGDGKNRPLANLRLATVDIQGTLDDATQSLWKQQTGAKTPWLVVRYPEALMLDAPLWSGQADRSAVDALLESPARRELTRRLLAGQSIVWVVIESSDANQNQIAIERLDQELKKLQTTVKLPDETARPGGVLKLPMDQGEGLLSNVPLRIEFSILRVSRDDPAERAFLATVLQTDPGLAEGKGTIVLPVFGRGRALQAFPGAELEADTIAGATEFLCGACSCSVKTQNPGMDLLLAANWEASLASPETASQTQAAPVEKTEPSEATTEPSVATTVPIPTGSQQPESNTTTAASTEPSIHGPEPRNLLAVVAGVLIVLTAIYALGSRCGTGG